jgi:hypothetical protein
MTMTTESEVKIARYNEISKEADKFGRIIGVRRLKPSEQTKVAGMTSELLGYDEMTNSSGNKVQIPHRMPLLIASAVCMIDETHIPFPRNRGELDAIYDRLDVEGLAAAGKAFIRLKGDDEVESPLDETKNL